MQKPFFTIASPPQKSEATNGEDGQHYLTTVKDTLEYSRRIKFYAENTACRLFRPELWFTKSPLMEP